MTGGFLCKRTDGSHHGDEAHLCVCVRITGGAGIKSGRHRETVNQQQKDHTLMKFVQRSACVLLNG